MKKLFIVLAAISIATVSCGGGNEKNAETEARADEAKAEPEATTNEDNPDYTKGLELVAKSDCFTCHKVNEAAVGPAYKAVAERYTSSPEVIDTLANKVIKGGSGNWGQIPMTPHPQLSKEDAVAMVKYVLALKK